MKRKKVVLSVIISIILIFIAVIVFFTKNINITPHNTIESKMKDLFNEDIEDIEKTSKKNEWSKNIIGSTTKEEIPIPVGYEYKKGDLNSGIIVREVLTGAELLWIPYSANTEEHIVDEYYKNVQVYEIESNIIKSIQKYNGFYVYLNMNLSLEDLKEITNENYENSIKQLNVEKDEIYTHILSKSEIEQILIYKNQNNIKLDIGIEALTIGIYANISNQDEEIKELSIVNTREIASTDVATLAAQTNEEKAYYTMKNNIPIPSGFRYNYTNGVMSIQSIENPNLIYIWVPATREQLENAKLELKALYESYTDIDGDKISFEEGTDLYETFNSVQEELNEDVIKSIEKYKGFYISEAELGYNSQNQYFNKARGMKEYSAEKDINGGDYYRKSSYSEAFTKEQIRALAQSSCEEKSVVSHLMYGAEYDRALIWIVETNNTSNIIENIIYDSTSIGKYSNSNLNANSTKEESSKYLNGIWGLGGNLGELTEELHADGRYVVRGGDWSQKGTSASIASAQFVNQDDIDGETASKVGFRTCLYIKTDESVKENPNAQLETFIAEEIINNMEFEKIQGGFSRWTNDWDGVKVYVSPDKNSEVIKNLPFATRVFVEAKAKEKTSNNLWWTKVKVEGIENCVYVNAMQLTKTEEISGIEFVKGEATNRFCTNETKLYESPSQEANYINAELMEISTTGKSIDLQWAIVQKDGKDYYMLSDDLSIVKEEKIEGVMFDIYSTPKKRYVFNWYGTYLFNTINTENIFIPVHEIIAYANEVCVLGKAKEKTHENLWWVKILLPDNTIGFINAQDLTDDTFLVEIENNKNTDNKEIFLKMEEDFWNYKNGLTVYNKPDYSNTDILKAYSGEGNVKVIGKSVNSIWTMIEADGKTGYVYTNELSFDYAEKKTTNYITTILQNSDESNQNKLRTYINGVGKNTNNIEQLIIENVTTGQIFNIDKNKEYDEEIKSYYYEYIITEPGWYNIKYKDNSGNQSIDKIYIDIPDEKPYIYYEPSGRIYIITFETELKTLKINGNEVICKKSENGKYYYDYGENLINNQVTIEAETEKGIYSKININM